MCASQVFVLLVVLSEARPFGVSAVRRPTHRRELLMGSSWARWSAQPFFLGFDFMGLLLSTFVVADAFSVAPLSAALRPRRRLRGTGRARPLPRDLRPAPSRRTPTPTPLEARPRRARGQVRGPDWGRPGLGRRRWTARAAALRGGGRQGCPGRGARGWKGIRLLRIERTPRAALGRGANALVRATTRNAASPRSSTSTR